MIPRRFAWMLLLPGILMTGMNLALAGKSPSVPSAQLQSLIEECDSCHGTAGLSPHADVPSLAGQSADALMSAIGRFYSYERHCPTSRPRHPDGSGEAMNMCEVSGRMSESDASALAEYYAAQAPDSGQPAQD